MKQKFRRTLLPPIQINDFVIREGEEEWAKVVAGPFSSGDWDILYKTPKAPKEKGVCDSCKWPGMLSRNHGTGEIVCMRSGCGHDHGFDENTNTIHESKLILEPGIYARRTFTNCIVNMFFYTPSAESIVNKWNFPREVKEDARILLALKEIPQMLVDINAYNNCEKAESLLVLIIPTLKTIAPDGWDEKELDI